MTSPVLISLHRSCAVTGARPEFLAQMRRTGRDDLGDLAVRFRSPEGGEPLRDQLRRAKPGEELLLGSYQLFPERSPFREFGPVYITADKPAVQIGPDDVFGGDYFQGELILRRYDHRRWIASARRVTTADAMELAAEWLAVDGTAFVDARFPEYGCFACRFAKIHPRNS